MSFLDDCSIGYVQWTVPDNFSLLLSSPYTIYGALSRVSHTLYPTSFPIIPSSVLYMTDMRGMKGLFCFSSCSTFPHSDLYIAITGPKECINPPRIDITVSMWSLDKTLVLPCQLQTDDDKKKNKKNMEEAFPLLYFFLTGQEGRESSSIV